ncbi:MAG: hypothetical protein NBV68_03030 [Erythrobacter sp.]|uniref:hypothetical protein n=1 Tax=Erythrobacter sp. TaxID=1042 RepID=UPI0025E23E95|nr:hypothetical protein [Erythrobacter sp.]MCL9998332.1 hypothetical protein [Erythrobacter sp.]
MAALTLPWALLLGLAALPASAAPPPEMPRFLRQLDRAVHAGDWTLQCNSGQFCQIIGVVRPPRDHIGVRTVVMIERGPAAGAAPRLRLAFLDSLGALAVPPPEDHWRLIARGLMRREALPLGLGPVEADGAYRASPEATPAIIAALRRWPGAAVHNGERVIARMPRGDLDRLMRRMDRLQHPGTDPLTPEERVQWLQEYHYTVLRGSAAEPVEGLAPDAVEAACPGRALANRPFLYSIGPQHRLWIAECPDGNHVFLQPDGADPIHFEMRDTVTGKIRRHDYAGVGGDGLLMLQLPGEGGRSDCGRVVRFGWTGSAFAMIREQRYARCRGVPHQFWPRVWYPTSWRYAEAPPSDGGNAPPAAGEVSLPAKNKGGIHHD